MPSDRTPKACPLCGQDGSFGGLGPERKRFTRTRSGGQRMEVVEHRTRFHCPECDGEFLVRDETETIPVGELE